MAFASAVALSGRFGIDVDLESTTRAEDDVLSRAVEWARRTQDVVQQGTVRRYVSPVDGADRSRAAFSVTLGDRTVVFAYQLEESTSTPPVIRLRGLPPAGTYRVRTTDLHGPAEETTSTDDELDRGIEWPLDRPLSARLWEIEPARRTA